MKNAENKGISRKIRLEKGYKPRLTRFVKNKGFGVIEYIARETQIHRDTITSTLKDGKANKTNKAKLEAFIDREIPVSKKKKVGDAAA